MQSQQQRIWLKKFSHTHFSPTHQLMNSFCVIFNIYWCFKWWKECVVNSLDFIFYMESPPPFIYFSLFSLILLSLAWCSSENGMPCVAFTVTCYICAFHWTHWTSWSECCHTHCLAWPVCYNFIQTFQTFQTCPCYRSKLGPIGMSSPTDCLSLNTLS